MSLDAILWALKDAPVADAEERLVLVTLAEAADDDGCTAYPSTKTIARRALIHQRTVQRRLDALRSRGLLALGDQAAAARIPEHRRPTVYDLQIPHSWFANVDRINETRALRGRTPLTPAGRPDLHDAPARARRKDAGCGRVIHRGDYKSPPGTESPGDCESGEGVTTSHPNQSLKETLPSSRPAESRACPPSGEDRPGSREEEALFQTSPEPPGVDRVLTGVTQAWKLGARTRGKLRPLIVAALATHGAELLLDRLAANPNGARNPLAVLRNRLADLPEPPSRPALPTWCGRCDSPDSRWIETTGGLAPCPTCSPQAAGRGAHSAVDASTTPAGASGQGDA